MIKKKRIEKNFMDELLKTKTLIIKNAIIITSVGAVVAIFFSENHMPYIKGMLFGFLIAVLCFQQLSLSISKAVNLPPDKAQFFVGTRYFIRLFIYALVIYISIRADYINLIGTLFGLLSIKISIVISSFLKKL